MVGCPGVSDDEGASPCAPTAAVFRSAAVPSALNLSLCLCLACGHHVRARAAWQEPQAALRLSGSFRPPRSGGTRWSTSRAYLSQPGNLSWQFQPSRLRTATLTACQSASTRFIRRLGSESPQRPHVWRWPPPLRRRGLCPQAGQRSGVLVNIARLGSVTVSLSPMVLEDDPRLWGLTLMLIELVTAWPWKQGRTALRPQVLGKPRPICSGSGLSRSCHDGCRREEAPT